MNFLFLSPFLFFVFRNRNFYFWLLDWTQTAEPIVFVSLCTVSYAPNPKSRKGPISDLRKRTQSKKLCFFSHHDQFWCLTKYTGAVDSNFLWPKVAFSSWGCEIYPYEGHGHGHALRNQYGLCPVYLLPFVKSFVLRWQSKRIQICSNRSRSMKMIWLDSQCWDDFEEVAVPSRLAEDNQLNDSVGTQCLVTRNIHVATHCLVTSKPLNWRKKN